MYPQCAISRGIHYGLKMIFAIFFCNTYLIPQTDSIGIEWHIIDNISMQMVRDKLLDMGCKVEISNLPSFVSINVPQEVSLKVVEDVLTNMQKECDSLAYEHGVVRQNIS